ncbi:PASTA domain-containing protein [Catellatospora sichuanensis]|uniref:PASTA domain-containing protein n=1 Tax=Catellatospora sichuanensis TaxID=1969805 RepID=UPI00164352A3|nr:PASTA domain-containing protein [Catellatospora sichuanensis]
MRSPESTPTPPTQVVVPDGVGKDYQAAQDIWRAAGLHVAPAHDATGAHRLPMIDSNWVVLSQNPPAGGRVDAGSFITATVKKYTDD